MIFDYDIFWSLKVFKLNTVVVVWSAVELLIVVATLNGLIVVGLKFELPRLASLSWIEAASLAC